MKKEDLKKVIQKLTVLADGKSLHRESVYTPTISAASITAVNLAIESVAEGNIDVNILECVEESYRQYTYADDKLFNGMHIKNICNGAEWSIVGWNYTGVVLGQLPCTVTHIVSYKKLMEDYTKPDGGLLGVAICPRKKEKV